MVAVIELHQNNTPAQTQPLRPGTGRRRFQDAEVRVTLDAFEVVGEALRDQLTRAIRAKLLLRGGRDPICIAGARGTGRHLVADAMHALSGRLLGRTGGMERVLCGLEARKGDLLGTVERQLRAARGGTLLLDQLDALTDVQRQAVVRLIARYEAGSRASVLVLAIDGLSESATWRGPRLNLPPCHERGDDLVDLAAHFALQALDDAAAEPGLETTMTSAGLLGGIASHARKTRVESIGALRELVRDLVFDALAEDDDADRGVMRLLARRGWTAPTSVPEPDVDAFLLERLAGVHGVGEETLLAQMRVIADLMETLGDLPCSYTNVMRRAEDIKRAGLWLLTGASSQAEFRRWFGEEDFMRPSKSGAWALYHQVFRLDD